MSSSYHLVITGAIASGKSSLIKHILNKFPQFKPQYEFLDNDPEYGMLLLNRFINRKISPFNMQSSILDIISNYYVKSDFMIFERSPDDNLQVFTLPMNLKKYELDYLITKTDEINQTFDIPSFLNGDLIHVYDSNESTYDQATELIKSDLENGIQKRIIGLKIDLNTCLTRIKKRGRADEDKYDVKYLKNVIDEYDKIFDKYGKVSDRQD